MKKREKIIGSIVILVLFSIFFIIGLGINNVSHKSNAEDIFVVADSSTTSIKSSAKPVVISNQIRVEIKGEVKNPDVYTLNVGAIVLDLVKVAGGYNDIADKDSIIQASKLNDGDCIYVKKKGDSNSSIVATVINSSGKININTATKEQLMKLDGIGDSRADKIIQYRQQNGPYKVVEDLKKIGARIGDTIINNIKDKVEVR